MKANRALIFAISAVLGLAAAFQATQRTEADPNVSRTMDAQRNDLLRQESFYAKWRVTLTRSSAREPVHHMGSYEIWRSGERFRIHSFADSSLGLAADLEISFDGSRTYLLDRRAELLMIEPGEPGNIPTSLPDPTLLKLAFLDVEPPDCAQCRLTFRDLKNEKHWQERTEVKKGGQPFVTVSSRRANSPRFEIFTSDGGDIVRIQRFTPQGRLEARFDFATGSSAADRLFPPSVTVGVFQDRETPALELWFDREELSLAPSFPLGFFEIASERAAVVWDGTSRNFRKLRQRE